ncbi:MAG: helix-turn-helix domain-containing protein [Ignavibacteria bacterium]|nr:helix-turn-helix domain-containing protein [Ignavibacteria bacterium]
MSTQKNEFFNAGEWITQSEAARLRGISRQAINKLVKKSRLKTFCMGSIIFVNKDEIENFLPQKVGRKNKSKL